MLIFIIIAVVIITTIIITRVHKYWPICYVEREPLIKVNRLKFGNKITSIFNSVKLKYLLRIYYIFIYFIEKPRKSQELRW